jgi:hypothetical protein
VGDGYLLHYPLYVSYSLFFLNENTLKSKVVQHTHFNDKSCLWRKGLGDMLVGSESAPSAPL